MKLILRRRRRLFAALLLAMINLWFATPVMLAGVGVTRESFGKLENGTQIDLYTVKNSAGLEIQVMTLGATLRAVKAPDREGKIEDITLHRKTLSDYEKGHPLLGSVVGRFANRIAGARFVLDSTEHQLVKNAGEHHIHGGNRNDAFHWQVWRASMIRNESGAGVKLSLVSPDGQAGFPGRLEVSVEYRLGEENELTMEYRAETDKATHVNLTNHAYWNLGGIEKGDVNSQVLELRASHYLPADKSSMPTGKIASVENTAMTFLEPTAIGKRLDALYRNQYDHCYVIDRKPGKRLSLAARAYDPRSGRVMEVFTTQPGVQLYTGNKRAFCLETQHFPNTPNVPIFPSTVLRPGETFHEITIHKFSTDKRRAKQDTEK